MVKKLCLVLAILTLIFTFTGCEYNEINKKLISDEIIISDNEFMVVSQSNKEEKLYDTKYKTLDNSLKVLKKKYDLAPFLSHSKVIIISAEITVNKLEKYIDEIKSCYQIPPDIKLTLAESSVITMIKENKITTDEISIIVKNSSRCDNRICCYENDLIGKQFTVLYENDGKLNIKQITI